MSSGGQLLLYASLVRAVLGRLPTSLLIQDAAGRRRPMEFTEADVDEAVRDVDDGREHLNLAIGGGTDLAQLAAPEPDHCASCSQAPRLRSRTGTLFRQPGDTVLPSARWPALTAGAKRDDS